MSVVKASIKLVVIGDSTIGKTSMLLTYKTDAFPSTLTVFDNFAKNITIGGIERSVGLWTQSNLIHYTLWMYF